MKKQQTLAKSAFISGIALHTGVRATLKMLPAEENSGIVFSRIDLPGAPCVKALASNVVDVRRGTTIANKENGAMVYTIEHIMSAFHAFGIDNALVEMNGAEPPICDGSSIKFIEMIKSAGIVEQNAEAKYFTPATPLFVEEGGTKLVIVPGDELKIACTTSFKGCPFDPQFFEVVVTADSFEKEISEARTFVRYDELQALLAMGLVKGGSLDAASIIHDGAIICKEKLRYKEEIVRHKILDIIGDIYLCGRRVTGTIIAIKPGHPKNVDLATAMLKEINKL